MAVVVSLDEKRKGKPSGLEGLLAIAGAELEQVNQAILDRMQSHVALIPQVAGHLVEAGGKRLRPLLTLAAARLSGYRGRDHVLLAACVEFIHTATLLHDDVVDGSDLRRGKPSANALWGNKSSVLVGDFMFTRAFELMVEVGSLDVLRILSEASSVIAEGEVLQMQTANNTAASEQAYLDVIKAKTAKRFAAACQIGGVIAKRPAAECEALESYGTNIGIAFQLVDDVLDYSAKQATLGKALGDDFREGKITLPVILAFRRGDDKEREFWRRVMERLEQNDSDLEHAVALMTKHNALSDTLDRARHYGRVARDAMGLFPDSAEKRAFIDVVDFSIERGF
jgi:octaprenyl-diphosphate synthase